MSKLDQKYIDNLQKFTDALEGLVEQMKGQQKEGTSDVVNEMLKNMDSKIDLVIKNQETLKANQKNIKKDTSDILKEIKQIKNREKTGGLSAISETDNGKKVGDAVKSIILIAGGILAIGMAFKIVGNIDFASVVGLSIGILVAVEAFKKISDMDIGVTDMVFSGLMMIIMAGSLVATGFILSMMPTMSIGQGLTLLLVAGTVGVATWLVMQGISKIDVKKNWAEILLIPLLLPLVATGIWLSSMILSNVAPISWNQALSVAITGVAIGVASFAVGLAMKGMKGATWKEILAIPVVIPLIALGITLSSVILMGFQPIQDPMGLLKGALVIGLAVLVFTPSFVLIGKFIGGNFAAIAAGTIGIIGISMAIVATAWIFKLLPDDMSKYPTVGWGIGVGLSMLAFVPSLVILGLIASSGVGAIVLLAGAAAILGLAGVMVGVSLILNEGNFDKYPSLWWSLGVGLSLVIFSAAALIAIPAMIGSSIMQYFGADDPLVGLAKSMVAVSNELQSGVWNDNYPSLGWALGVGASLLAFAAISVGASAGSLVSGILNFFSGDDDPIGSLSQSMVDVSKTLQSGVWNDNYPSILWATGVGAGLLAFAAISVGASAGSLVSGILNFFSGDDDPIGTLAQSMVDVSITLQKGVWNGNYPSLLWATGVGAGLLAFAAISVGAAAGSLVSGIMSFFSGDDDPIGTLAQSMVGVSIKLQEGIWNDNFPSLEWTLGVGAGLLAFGGITVGASAASLVSGVMNFFSGDNDPLGTLAKSMVSVSIKLQEGKWGGNYPSLEWSSAVGAGLVAFGAITVGASAANLVSGVLSFFSGDDDPIGTLAQSMVDVSIKLSAGNFSSYPEPIWIDNVSYGLLGIAKVIDEVDLDMDDMENFNYFLTNVLPNFQNLSNFPNLDPFVENVNKFVGVVNSIPDNKHEAIKNLSESIRDFSDALREVDMSTLDKLSTISQGVLLVSIIDEAKLRGVLDAMTEKQAELKEIYGDEEKEGVLSKFGNWASGLMGSGEEREKTSTVAVVKDDRDVAKEDFYGNIASIRAMMSEMMDMMNSPGMSGNFNKSK